MKSDEQEIRMGTCERCSLYIRTKSMISCLFCCKPNLKMRRYMQIMDSSESKYNHDFNLNNLLVDLRYLKFWA